MEHRLNVSVQIRQFKKIFMDCRVHASCVINLRTMSHEINSLVLRKSKSTKNKLKYIVNLDNDQH